MLIAASAADAAGIAGSPASTARPARTRAAGPASFTTIGSLVGVAATSARRAWAVGRTRRGKTLILQWNGVAWKRVPSPPDGILNGVAAASARRAWAVGYAGGGGGEALIVHWNGTAWK